MGNINLIFFLEFKNNYLKKKNDGEKKKKKKLWS